MLTELDRARIKRAAAARGLAENDFIEQCAASVARAFENDPRESPGLGTTVYIFVPGTQTQSESPHPTGRKTTTKDTHRCSCGWTGKPRRRRAGFEPECARCGMTAEPIE